MPAIARRTILPPRPTAGAVPSPAAASPARARRALIVDDDALARRFLEDLLGVHGFAVRSAADGLAGLRALAEEVLELDVVVTDVLMPGLDGEQLIQRIRVAGGEQDLGIVVVTAGPADAHRLRAMGADAVVAKADGIDAIVDAIELASARAERARGAARAG